MNVILNNVILWLTSHMQHLRMQQKNTKKMQEMHEKVR